MDRASEHALARRSGGLTDLSKEGWIRASGEGARAFLQRLVANDVLALEPGQGRRSLLLDAKGKIESDLRILRSGEQELLIQAPESAREKTWKMLTLYGIADPVEFEDLASARALLTLQG
ncbi:hypothetical protein HY251_09010, partial [bacterium]|nr:hypothetical protein [bacterium]